MYSQIHPCHLTSAYHQRMVNVYMAQGLTILWIHPQRQATSLDYVHATRPTLSTTHLAARHECTVRARGITWALTTAAMVASVARRVLQPYRRQCKGRFCHPGAMDKATGTRGRGTKCDRSTTHHHVIHIVSLIHINRLCQYNLLFRP